MNETIKVLKNHRSVREFQTEKEVTDSQIREIIETAMAAPNWINGQQVSIIEVRDPIKKTKFAEAAGNQLWIKEAPVFLVFCLDFHRAKLAAEKNGIDLRIVDDIEAIIIGSTDVGIALSNAIVAAESMGLGVVPIGGIRRNPETFIEMLNLPEYVFPVTGLSVGYPKNIPDQKPRLPREAIHHKERYNLDVQKQLMNEYDKTISTYQSERKNGNNSANWSTKVSTFYETGFEAYAKNVTPALKKQGFKYK
jgi:FMN reductase [NAD(P)H]